jgi:hypothetical protein
MKSGKTIGIIFAIAIVFSFVFAGCETGTSPTANADPKNIIITGFPRSDYSGKAAMITLHSSSNVEEATAVGYVSIPINGTGLTIPLYNDENLETRWNGSGEYYVLLMIGNIEGDIEKAFVYSDDKPNAGWTNVPAYSITELVSTISFNDFHDITDWAKENGAIPTIKVDPKTIIITGFNGSAYNNKFASIALLSPENGKMAAIGFGLISGNKSTIPLYIDENLETMWKGSGEYYVLLMIANDKGDIEKAFVYSDREPNYSWTNVPAYSITESESTILFSEFYDITEWAKENDLIPTTEADPKTIIVTGFPGSSYSGKVAMITLHPSLMSEKVAAVGGVPINGNRLTIPLYTDENLTTRWKETGEYYVLLMIGTGVAIEKVFIYSDVKPNYSGTNVPRYSITESESTIPFLEFYDITEWAIENGLL